MMVMIKHLPVVLALPRDDGDLGGVVGRRRLHPGREGVPHGLRPRVQPGRPVHGERGDAILGRHQDFVIVVST